jgi:hypothetical protein
LLGSVQSVDSGDSEGNPAVACNSDDQTCLAVYEKRISPNDQIHGRRIEVSGAGLSIPQAAFEVTNALAESKPDVAWNHDDQQFMVVWQHWWVNVDPPSHYLLTFRPFWDTHQPVNQWQAPPYGLVLTTCGLGNGQTEPAIAYSRGAYEYVVAFQYDWNGDGSDYDIAALRLEPDGTRTCPFYVANTTNQETSPAIAYSGGPEHVTSMYGNPQYQIAYASQEPSEAVLYIQGVKDRHDSFGVQLDGNRQGVDWVPSAGGGNVVAPDVTGSAHNGRYLTVWQRDPQQDILGHLAAPYGGVFSIAGTSFVSAGSAHSYEYRSWGGITLTPGGAGSSSHLVASVELPEGVTVAALTMYFFDPGTEEHIQLELARYDGAGGVEAMAWPVSFHGISQQTMTSISYPTVDNANYTYMLSAEVASAVPDPQAILYGAKITYVPNADAPKGPFSTTPASAPPSNEQNISVSGLPGEEAATAHHSGGTVRLLKPAPAADGEPSKEAGETDNTRPVPAPAVSEASNPQGLGTGAFDWKRHTVSGSNFHPTYSDTAHNWYSGGARYVISASTSLVAPLNLIHGKTIQHARFTYYDDSVQNPDLWLYQVDRQGDGALLWAYSPDASGGSFVATSPFLGTLVDNHNYAYYFIAKLGEVPAGSDLRAIEIEIAYVSETYLPLIVRNS